MISRFLWIAIIFMCSIKVADADLNQYMVRTTEWLVDHSAVICVVQFDNEGAEVPDAVLAILKGDASTIEWPLQDTPFDGYHYFGPPSEGHIRLLYISDDNELLQSVNLRRGSQQPKTLHGACYGVDQHGQVHLTESSLIHRIRQHQRARPSRAISQRRQSSHFARSGVEAPPDFPFESSDETFVLVVDFNVERRDFYLDRLKAGNFIERLHAINELSQLEDAAAYSAIESATAASDVERSFAYELGSGQGDVDFDIQVQNAAKRALEHIQRNR